MIPCLMYGAADLLMGHWFGRHKQKQGGNAFKTIYNVVLKPLSSPGLDAAYN